MADEKQQNRKAKQSHSEHETYVVKTQDSGLKTAPGPDVRSDSSKILGLESRISTGKNSLVFQNQNSKIYNHI